jgi:uncharacterized protein (TIGR03086 family)
VNSVELLERSLAYALGSVAAVVPGSLGRATPCAQWDLGELLCHLDDSVDALYEGVASGSIGLRPGQDAADPVCAFRERAGALLGAWAVAAGELPCDGVAVAVGGRALELGLLAAVGAVEIAVHGWDVAQASGRPRPLPPSLAADLFPVARCIVADADRGVRFAEPVGVPARACPGDRLVAFLGRRPDPPRFLSGRAPVCLS